jgi:hypothetical protein
MEGSVGDSSQSTISAWTLIATAKGQGKPASDALGALLMQYRQFIIRTLGKLRPPPDKDLDELFQAYAFTFVRTELVNRLERYGSLRGFLKRSLGFFVLSEWTEYKKWQCQVPGDWEPYDSQVESDIDIAYVGAIVTQALQLARTRSPNPERFDRFARFLPGPQCDFAPQAPLAAELGLTHGALAGAIHDERQRYQRSFDELVLATIDVSDGEGNPARCKELLEAEKKALCALLYPPPPGITRKFESELD